MDFPLIPATSNPMLQCILRMLAIVAVAALPFITVLYLLGPLTLNGMLFFNLSVVAAYPLIAWSLASSYRGTVMADGTGFTMKSAMRGSYRWSDVVAVRVTDLAETSGRISLYMLTALRVTKTQPFVQIHLHNRPRVSLLRNRIGSDVTLGIPSITSRLGFYLRDPEVFIRYASTFISPPDPSTPTQPGSG